MARVAAESCSGGTQSDHGTSFEQAMQCIGKGFSAVMVDGSMLEFEDNVAW